VGGGKIDIAEVTQNVSVRNMFMNLSPKISDNKLLKFTYPEKFVDWHKAYDDLSEFEVDIAALSSKIILIPETPGSLAELGLFYGNAQTREKLVVILHRPHFEEDSFIKHGILNPLEKVEEGAVLPFDINYNRMESIEEKEISDILQGLNEQCSELPLSAQFSTANRGHILLLIYQLIELFSAITIAELKGFLSEFGLEISPKKLRSALYVLEIFELIFTKKRNRTTCVMTTNSAGLRVVFAAQKGRARFDYFAMKIMVMEYYKYMADLKTRTYVDRLKLIEQFGGQ